MTKKQKVVVAVSGGFDPLHVGHLRLFEEAKKLGTKLVVILNNDNWLRKKKGYALMPEGERAAIIRALRMVDDVVITDHTPNDSDVSVCRAIEKIRPDIFANAGDRKKPGDIPEAAVCTRNAIALKFFTFGDLQYANGAKRHSSSHIVRRAVARFVRLAKSGRT